MGSIHTGAPLFPWSQKTGRVDFFCPFCGAGGVFWVMVRFESEKYLAEFVSSRSEEAFRKVVEAQSGLVLGAAARRLGGDRSAAEDVMQEVFVLLAKKAGALVKGKISVSGWLYRQTCRLAANRVRGEVRRRKREERFGLGKDEGIETKNEMTVEIDEALLGVSEEERELVLARYVEGRDYAEIGKRLGTTTEAARKRVGRAVEKLRVVLEKSGVRVSASALAVILVGVSGPRASAELVGSVSGAAMKSAGVTGGGMFSIAGILAGAAGVSVLMGGVRIMEAKNDGASAPDGSEIHTRAVRERPRMIFSQARKMTVDLTEDEVFRRLIELDGKPDSVIKSTERDYVLRAISASRVFPFMERCERQFSIDFEEKVFGELVSIGVKDAPLQTLDEILKRGNFWQIRSEVGSGFWSMGQRGLAEWTKSDLQGAADWLARNWKRIDETGGVDSMAAFGDFAKRRRSKGDWFELKYSVAEDYLADFTFRYWRVLGDDAVDRYLKNYREQIRLIVWKRILKSGRIPNGEIYSEEMAQKLVRFPDDGIYGEMKEVVWLHWAQLSRAKLGDDLSWQQTLEEYQKKLPQKYRAAFGEACLEPVQRILRGGGK